jgi:cell division inhibitor SulA
MSPARAASLSELLQNPFLWRGDALARAEASMATGFTQLDQELPGGGWPKAALTELLHDSQGIGEMRLLLPALKRIAHADERVVLVVPPHVPYAPAFAAAGIDPSRVIVIRTAEDNNAWWAAEQVLRSNSAGALLFWPQATRDQTLRRLQVAAQESESLAFCFTDTRRSAQPSPAPLRIRLSLVGSNLCIDVFKRRGGVMTRPLLLDVTTSLLPTEASVAAKDPRASKPAVRLLPMRERMAVNRSASFARHYPVGGPNARVWNRALGHADEVRRGNRPDPRNHEELIRDDALHERHRYVHG